jgi:hypothetical protein
LSAFAVRKITGVWASEREPVLLRHHHIDQEEVEAAFLRLREAVHAVRL